MAGKGQQLRTDVIIGGRVDSTWGNITRKLDALSSQVSGIYDKLVSIGSESVEKYAEIERKMVDAKDAAELTSQQVQTIYETTKKLAGSSVFSMEDLATAFDEASHAGMEYEQMMELIPHVMTLATAGGMDMTTAMGEMITLINAGKVPMDEWASTIDAWVYAANKTPTTVSEMGEAVQSLSSTAFFADNTEELFTLLGTLARMGIVGNEAGTVLKTAVLRVIAPTATATAQLDEMNEQLADMGMGFADGEYEGISSELKKIGFSAYDSAGNLKPLLTIFGDLSQSMLDAGYTAEEQNKLLNKVFGVRGIKAGLAFMDATKTGGLTGFFEDIAGSEGYAAMVAADLQGTLSGSLTTLGNAFGVLQTNVGEQLAPQVQGVVDALIGLINGVNEMDPALMAALVGGLEGIAGISGLMMAGSAVGKIVSALVTLGPGGVIAIGAAAGLGALAAGISAANEAIFEGQFGTLDIEKAPLVAMATRLNTEFANGGNVQQYADALSSAFAGYTDASSALSQSLMGKMLSGEALTEPDRLAIEGYGKQMGEAMQNGIAASFDEATAFLMNVMGEDAGSSVIVLNSAMQSILADAQALGTEFGKTLGSAMDDGIITGEEYATIIDKMNAYNEAMAEYTRIENAGEMAVRIHRAQTVSWDSYEAFAKEQQTAMEEALKIQEEEYWRTYGKLSESYDLGIAKGQYTKEEKAAALALLEQNQADAVSGYKSDYANVQWAAIEALMGGENGGVWNALRSIYGARENWDAAVYRYAGAFGDSVADEALQKAVSRILPLMKGMEGTEQYGFLKFLDENLDNIFWATTHYDQKTAMRELQAEHAEVIAELASAEMTVGGTEGQIDTLNARLQALTTAIYEMGGVPGQEFALGGRATTASIFGEAGAEWAIPEKHDARTRSLLAAAAAASGFTWGEIARAGKGGGGTFVYSPTIYAENAAGVEEKLMEDKARMEAWWSEHKMREAVMQF